jgi:hypothetical protein
MHYAVAAANLCSCGRRRSAHQTAALLRGGRGRAEFGRSELARRAAVDAASRGEAGLMAHADAAGQREQRLHRLREDGDASARPDADRRGAIRIVADAEGWRPGQGPRPDGEQGPGDGPDDDGIVGDADDARLEGRELLRERAGERAARPAGLAGELGDADTAGRGPLSGRGRIPSLPSVADLPASVPFGFWSDADWIACRDGKARPVEPGTFPLASRPSEELGRLRSDWRAPAGPQGFANRTGRLRGYGNAIVAPLAETFIRATMK